MPGSCEPIDAPADGLLDTPLLDPPADGAEDMPPLGLEAGGGGVVGVGLVRGVCELPVVPEVPGVPGDAEGLLALCCASLLHVSKSA
jgi:hypothetical protein